MLVLIDLGVVMPQCCVLNRWTLNAKSGSPLDTADPVRSMKGTRLSELMNLAKQVFEEAACSTNEYLRWKGILEQEREVKRTRDGVDNKSSCPVGEENHLDAEASPINVLDPEPVQSKGAPKKFKSFMDKPKKRRCSECSSPDHDRRTCPKLRRLLLYAFIDTIKYLLQN